MICILYKPGSDWYVHDWLSRQNCTENKNEDIAEMKHSVDTVSTITDMLFCMLIEDTQEATQNDVHLQELEGVL